MKKLKVINALKLITSNKTLCYMCHKNHKKVTATYLVTIDRKLHKTCDRHAGFLQKMNDVRIKYSLKAAKSITIEKIEK